MKVKSMVENIKGPTTQENEESKSPYPLDLTLQQKQDLGILLDHELKNNHLTKEHADRLNDVFQQLLGRNHDEWEKRFGSKE